MSEEKKGLKPKHYETLAKWAKDVGIGAGGVLIAPQLINGLSISNPVAIFGLILMIGMFTLAYYWLKKS